MPLTCSRGLFCLCSLTILCFCSRLVFSAWQDEAEKPSAPTDAPKAEAAADAPAEPSAEPEPTPEPTPPPLTEQSYTGSNQCFMCHRPHTDRWSESKHAAAFTDLPERYRNDASCLKCHVTAYGQPSGYAAGTEKDLLMVGCESCHGPGALHIDAARRFVLATPEDEAKIEKEMRQTIVKTPADSVCIQCHITQAHQSHPAYEGQRPKPSTHAALRPVAGAPAWHYPGYSIKTCGSCHYDRYKQWGREAHSALHADLPARYRNDQDCGKCHTNSDAAVRSPAAVGDPHHGQIGVACETCHGPGLEHVRLNMRLISSLALTPQQEQAARLSIRKAKPATTCIQCHVGESHKQHPEYAKDGSSDG